jgi:hypothetical protein
MPIDRENIMPLLVTLSLAASMIWAFVRPI